MKSNTALAVLVLALVAGSLPLAAAPVIQRGIDVFTTVDNGKTFYDFADDPIPAGFFCKGSPPFAGRLELKGLPLETEFPGQLRGADTVIERLDDAAFDANGTAVTRVQFRALSLVSSVPVQTPCGAFHVYVSLAGEQRPTTMHIYRTHERGGSFVAPLAVDARLRFVPTSGRGARPLELTGAFTFPATSLPWSFEPGPGGKQVGPVVTDTNGDLVPDTRLGGTSNFAAGWPPEGLGFVETGCFQCEPETCHEYEGKMHCSGPVVVCSPAVCP